MSERPTVFLVDDDASMRRTLPAAIRSSEHDIVVFDSAEAFLNGYNGAAPGCLILDLRMPQMSGLALQTEIARKGWSIPIIFLSAYGTVETATRAMKAGAVYFLEKPVEPATLIDHVQEAISLDAAQRASRMRQSDIDRRLSRLTRRQRHIMDLVVQGLTSKQIAEALGRSVKTVEVHRSQILRRMDVQGVAELMNLVLAGGPSESASAGADGAGKPPTPGAARGDGPGRTTLSN